MESYNPLQNNKYFAKDDDVILEIIRCIESGEEVWIPWGEEAETIDFYKYKKYQGSIEMISAKENLFNAYKLDDEKPNEKPFLMNAQPVNFEYATLLLLATATE